MFDEVRAPKDGHNHRARDQQLRTATPSAITSSLEEEVQRLRALLELRRRGAPLTPVASPSAAAAQKRERRSPLETLSPYTTMVRARGRRQRREGGGHSQPPPPPSSALFSAGAPAGEAGALTPEAVYSRFRAQHRAASWAAPVSPIYSHRSSTSSSSEVLDAEEGPPASARGEGRPTVRYVGTPPQQQAPAWWGPVTAADSSLMATPPPPSFSCETSIVVPPAVAPSHYSQPPPFRPLSGATSLQSPPPRAVRATPLRVGFALPPPEQQQEQPIQTQQQSQSVEVKATGRPASVVDHYRREKASWAALRAYYERYVKGANKTPSVKV